MRSPVTVVPDTDTRINVWRKRLGWTQEMLGEQLGVSTTSAGRYCLPPTHASHSRPNRRVGELLRKVSGGKVTVANYADLWTPEMDAELVAMPDDAAPAGAEGGA